LPFTKAECTKCHNPHKAKLQKLLLAQIPRLCLTCHTELKEKIYKKDECAQVKAEGTAEEDTGIPVAECDETEIYLLHAPSALENCLRCHKSHVSAWPNLINQPIQILCAECHDYKTESFNVTHINIDPYIMNCKKCHDSHTSKDPKFFKEDVHKPFETRTCEECHIVEKP
jgi:predicted CXXCH cytochrome family protein